MTDAIYFNSRAAIAAASDLSIASREGGLNLCARCVRTGVPPHPS